MNENRQLPLQVIWLCVKMRFFEIEIQTTMYIICTLFQRRKNFENNDEQFRYVMQ